MDYRRVVHQISELVRQTDRGIVLAKHIPLPISRYAIRVLHCKPLMQRLGVNVCPVCRAGNRLRKCLSRLAGSTCG